MFSSLGNCKYGISLRCSLKMLPTKELDLRKKLCISQKWEWGDAIQSRSFTTLKPFRIQIQVPQMPLLWGSWLLRRLQASNRKLFACMPEPKPQLWFSSINPQTWVKFRIIYITYGIWCILSRLFCFLQKKNRYLTCMYICIWLSICQYLYLLSKEGRCQVPSVEKRPPAQP